MSCGGLKHLLVLPNVDILSGPLGLIGLFCITKTYLYNFDPFKPYFYIVKLGFTGVYIIILISAQKHRLWVSNEYPQSLFGEEI